MVQIHPYVRPDQKDWLDKHNVQTAELIRRLIDEEMKKDVLLKLQLRAV